MKDRSVEIEMVKYRVSDIDHATGRLLYNFVNYSGISGTETWLRLRSEIFSLIRDQIPFNLLWEASGLDIHFSCFLEPRPVIRDGNVRMISPEPRFAFIERPEFMRPSVRTHVGNVIDAIAREMHDVYKLKVEHNPLLLIFPKEEYAKKIDLFTVPLII